MHLGATHNNRVVVMVLEERCYYPNKPRLRPGLVFCYIRSLFCFDYSYIMKNIFALIICFCSLYATAQPDPPPPPLCLVYSIISIPSADTVVCLNSGNLTLQGDTTNSTFSGPYVTNGIFAPTAVGTYRIFYTNADTCIKPDSVDITVVSPPAVPGAISGPTTVCNTEFSSNFSTSPVVGASSYQWSYTPVGIDGSTNSTSASINWVTSIPYCGPVTVSVAAVNACGNSAPQTYTLNLVCIPQPTLNVGGPYCLTTDAFQLTATVPGGTWSGCNITPNGVYTPSVPGPCTLVYGVTTSGCTAIAIADVTVNPQPSTTAITTPASVCQNTVVALNGTPAGGIFFPNDTLNTQTPGNVMYSYVIYGTYGCKDSTASEFTIQPLPTANFGWQQTDCKTLCFGDQSVNSFGWSWDFGDGSTGTSLNTCHTYDITPGTYCVTQIANNTCGTDDSTICITVECVSVAESSVENTIAIYPNPATTNLTINTGNLQNIQVELFDISGRKLVQQSVVNSLQTLDVSGLSNGVYICVVTAGNKVVKREKIIISR